ncbi:hypothetical protein FSARC_12626 [Fusarium sarcochroum]|uniref:Helitron helicase-like domain-containing protein n=1 Tax=Fusarium sarcochroum TaxID=1208366 RepID=A0A8H4T705_9HYPO|nr:hypothetical protein FSARC_12626 [Fusarium sarcochroum]
MPQPVESTSHDLQGQQYSYKGHVINFVKDVGQVDQQLPLLPRELDVILLRPQNQTAQPHMTRQFRGQFRVREGHIRQWLEFLRANHPGCRDVVIDEDHLSQLLQDGDITSQLIAELIEPAEIEECLQDDLDDTPGRSQQPDVPLEPAPGHEPQLEMPHIRSTPLNEFNRSQALLSLAFPTLLPMGEGDFIEPRERGVQYADYIERLMKFHDGVDISQLRAAFDPDSPAAKALLNSVVRYSGSLRGIRPFWGGQRHQLEAYVHRLGCPGIFLTFSTADLHWESLQQHMHRYVEWQNADNRGKVSIARRNLKENPHIAAHHFQMRFTSFYKHVIKPKFNITDSWFRYEWQARGSTHSHGLFWVKEAPTLNSSTEAS